MTATEKTQTLVKIDATVEAAKDVKVLDIIENALLDYPHDTTMTDDLVFAIQEYLQDQSLKIQGGLRLLAASAKLENIFSLAQKIKNSDAFQELVAEYTPDELSVSLRTSASSVHDSTKPEVVAVGTTASAVATPKSSKVSKGNTKDPKTPKVTPKLPLPTIASIADIEAMSRKDLMEAVKAVKSNNPDISIRANAATVELQKALASNLLGVDYITPERIQSTSLRSGSSQSATPSKPSKAPKTPKGGKSKTAEVIDLPEGFCWEDCKSMKYRDLQKVCKALRSQGLFQGNIGGKGATTANLLKGCADYFRSQGQDIVEVELKSQAPKADLHLPNWGAIVEQKRLEKATTAALKLSNEDAKVALELAVAA
jgi:hypothetical protein